MNNLIKIWIYITEMLVPGHVCSLYVATGGANGPALGSDEKEIVLLDYSVIDVLTNVVSFKIKNPTTAAAKCERNKETINVRHFSPHF